MESSTTAEFINSSRPCNEQDHSQDTETVVLVSEPEDVETTEQADVQAVQDVNHSWNPDMNDTQELQFSEVVEQQAQTSADTISCTQNEPPEDRQLDISDYQNVNEADLNSSYVNNGEPVSSTKCKFKSQYKILLLTLTVPIDTAETNSFIMTISLATITEVKRRNQNLRIAQDALSQAGG